MPLVGDSGEPTLGRPVFVGLVKADVLNFIAFSNAMGRSLAPGGSCFLLGLPRGVDTGVVKLLRPGVFGRSLLRVWRGGGGTGAMPSCLPPWEEGKRLDMKLDMVMYWGDSSSCCPDI